MFYILLIKLHLPLSKNLLNLYSMKKTLLLISCAILTMSSFIASAQNRKAVPSRDKSDANHMRVQSAATPHAVKKNSPGQMLTNALSGFYSEGFEGAFPPLGWQVIDVDDPVVIWSQSAASPYEGA